MQMENKCGLYKLNKDNLIQIITTIQKDYINVIKELASDSRYEVKCFKEDCKCFMISKGERIIFEYPKNMKYDKCYNCFYATCERHSGYINDWQCDHCNVTVKICEGGCADTVCNECGVDVFERK
jgi:hypothetical protein